jgi:hypothetical protein
MNKLKFMTLHANESVTKEEAKGISRRTHKKLNLSFLLIAVLISITTGGFFIACSSEDMLSEDTVNDMEIVNSVELEEYIIATSDLKQSFDIFEKELKGIDFSKLEVTYDMDGVEIMRLPSASVSAIRIEEKIQIFNEKKQSLREKYPQIASFSLDRNKKYIQQCIQSSLNVSDKLLEFGVNFSQPLLKSGTIETWSGSNLSTFLASWITNPNYVEIYIIRHENATNSTWIDDRNTSSSCFLTYTKQNGKYYIAGNSSPIAYIAHTHKSSKSASAADIAAKASMPGIPRYIYYGGSYYSY